jgi:hypothetical protein
MKLDGVPSPSCRDFWSMRRSPSPADEMRKEHRRRVLGD